MFDSIYSALVTPGQFLIMALASLLSGVLFSWMMSFRVRASRRFFIVSSVLPFVVGTVLTFVNGSIGAGVAFGGAFTLTRFRSAPGSADEIAAILIAAAAGVAFGMGYAAYGVLILVCLDEFPKFPLLFWCSPKSHSSHRLPSPFRLLCEPLLCLPGHLFT